GVRAAAPWRIALLVADRPEPGQQLPQGQRPLGWVPARFLGGVEGSDGILERLAADESHGVAGGARGVAAQGVDRHDARVLQPAGDFGLLEEAAAALGVAGPAGLEELQRHLAVELGVAGAEDLAEGTCGVEAEVVELGVRGGGVAARAGWGLARGDERAIVQQGVEPAEQGDAAGELAGQLGAGRAELLGRETLALIVKLFPAEQELNQSGVVA